MRSLVSAWFRLARWARAFSRARWTRTRHFGEGDFRSNLPRFTPEARRRIRPSSICSATSRSKRSDAGPDRAGLAAGPEAVDCSDSGHDEAHRLEENIGAEARRAHAPTIWAEIEKPQRRSQVEGATGILSKLENDRPVSEYMSLLGQWKLRRNQTWRSNESVPSLPARDRRLFTGTVRIDPLFQRADRRASGRQRHLRARRAHGMAHAPARPDPDRHLRLRPGAALGRPDRGDPARRRGLVRAGREALARRRANHGDDAHRHPGKARRQARRLDGTRERRAIREVITPAT